MNITQRRPMAGLHVRRISLISWRVDRRGAAGPWKAHVAGTQATQEQEQALQALEALQGKGSTPRSRRTGWADIADYREIGTDTDGRVTHERM